MGTLAILAITHGGKTQMKVITGSDGNKMPKFAEEVRIMIYNKGRMPTVKEMYEVAVKTFNPVSLVVMDKRQTKHKTGGPLNRLYRRTFNQPRFNPRWKVGVSDYEEVIEI